MGTVQSSLHFAPLSLTGLHQYICTNTNTSETLTLAFFCMRASVSYTGTLLYAGDPKLSAENKAVLRAGANPYLQAANYCRLPVHIHSVIRGAGSRRCLLWHAAVSLSVSPHGSALY